MKTSKQLSVNSDQLSVSSGQYVKAIGAIVWKDLRAEFRSWELLTTMLVFSFLAILIFNFALDLDIKARTSATPGVLWSTFVFAGTLGLNRSMSIEKDNGCLDGLMLTPVDRSTIFFGKFISNLVFMLFIELVILPVYSLLYNINLLLPELMFVILLGSVGYTAAGTLLSGMSVQTRTRDVLLPILLLPVTLPLVIAAVQSSNSILTNSALSDYQNWINLLLAYDVVLISASFMLFEFILED